MRANLLTLSIGGNTERSVSVTLAAAWHGGVQGASQEFANSSSLLDSIHSAMDFWFANDFTNLACLDSGGTPTCPCDTPGLWNTNWYSNVRTTEISSSYNASKKSAFYRSLVSRRSLAKLVYWWAQMQ